MTPATPTPKQLPLFADIGADELPAGMAALTRQEQGFVLSYLRTGLASVAAREAGYADPEADAAKIRRRPKVAAVLTQASRAAGGNAAALAAAMWQRKQAYRAEWEEIYPQIRAMRAAGLPIKANDEDRTQANYLDRLHFLENREKFLAGELARIEGLLKGIEITVTGAVQHQHTLAPEMQAHLLELQAGLLEAAA